MREAELSSQQDNHAFEFGKASIKAQSEDRAHSRIADRGKRRDLYVFLGFLVLLLTISVVIALYLNKDAVALELVKDIGLAALSAFGGYGLGKSKAKDKAADEPPTE